MFTHVALPICVLYLSALVPSIAVSGVRPVTLFLAPLIGSLIAGFAAAFELAVGGAFIFWFLVIAILLCLVSIVVRVALLDPGDRQGRSRGMWRMLHVDEEWRSVWPWVTTFVIVGAVVWPLHAFQVPIDGGDARVIWTLHSLFIYGGHHTYLAALKNPQYAFSNPGYPPLVSASGALGFVIYNASDYHLATSVTVILNACALGVVACGIALVPGKGAPPWVRVVAVGAGAGVCLIGFGVNEPYAVAGYADLLWAASALAATIYGLLLPRSSSHFAIGWIGATVAALTKNEGLAVALVIMLLMSIRYIPASSRFVVMHAGRPERRFELRVRATLMVWLPRAGLWLAMAAPSLLWPLLMKYEGIGSDFFGSSDQSIGERFQPTISAIADNLHILPVAAAVAIVGGLTLRRARAQIGLGASVWIWIVIAWSLIALAGTYVFGALPIPWWLMNSVNRTTVFAQIALYADMGVWMVISVTQFSGFRSDATERDGPTSTAVAI